MKSVFEGCSIEACCGAHLTSKLADDSNVRQISSLDRFAVLMSLITLQLGQCGNQLGYDFHSLLALELLRPGRFVASDVFFRQTRAGYIARALLLDMEPKVVNSCISRTNLASNLWKYDPRNAVVQQSGSGASFSRARTTM